MTSSETFKFCFFIIMYTDELCTIRPETSIRESNCMLTVIADNETTLVSIVNNLQETKNS